MSLGLYSLNVFGATGCESRSICASKSDALRALFDVCDGGSVWCLGEIWQPWKMNNQECYEEGQVVCVQACARQGAANLWCLRHCK